MPKPKLVIFCGAGFSTTAGIPVMSEFTNKLRASEFLGENQAEFDRLLLQCEAMGMLIGANTRNLEQLSSFLSVLNLTRPDFEFNNCPQFGKPSEAIKLIDRCIRRLVRYDLNIQQLGEAVSIFDAAHFADLSFVTTNYDVVLELAGWAARRRMRPTDDIYAA